MIISGGSDGIIAVSSPTTGMTVRVISDHKGVAISSMDVALTKVGVLENNSMKGENVRKQNKLIRSR